MLELYDYELSGNCYKIRLILSFLNLDYISKKIEFYPSEEHKSEVFLKINPLGQLPVISDGGLILRDCNGADREDSLPTAAQLIANFASPAVNTAFRFISPLNQNIFCILI